MSEAQAKGPTPGPWGWFGNADGTDIYLSTVNHGRRFVMQFSRWGMRSAQPVFQVKGVMREAKHLLKFQVGNREVTGIDAAKADSSVYRLDISGIDHPDACLIQHAPDLLAAVQTTLADLEANIADGRCRWYHRDDASVSEPCPMCGHRDHLKALVAKATGQTPA